MAEVTGNTASTDPNAQLRAQYEKSERQQKELQQLQIERNDKIEELNLKLAEADAYDDPRDLLEAITKNTGGIYGPAQLIE